jgi:hypothetical protein
MVLQLRHRVSAFAALTFLFHPRVVASFQLWAEIS